MKRPSCSARRHSLGCEPLEARALLASISGLVFRDQNQNGLREGGESPLPGWQTYIDENGNGQYDARAHTTMFHSTDVPLNLPDITDTTSIIEVPHLDTAVGHITVTLDMTHPHVRDFSVYLVSPRGELYSLMFQDFSGPGGNNFTNTTFDDDAAVYVNDAEAPFTGTFRPNVPFTGLNGQAGEGTWGLRVYDGRTGAAGTLNSWSIAITTGEPIQTADADGKFKFTGLTAGQHNVKQFDYPSWTQTRPAAQAYDVNLAANQNYSGALFGDDLENSSISGMKFNDANGNGIFDPGESPLGGWNIYLDLNSNSQRDPDEPLRSTDAQGRYSFNDLAPGNYIVREIVKYGWKGATSGATTPPTASAAAAVTVTATAPRVHPKILVGRDYAPNRLNVMLQDGVTAEAATLLRNSLGANLQRRLAAINTEIWQLPLGLSVQSAMDQVWNDWQVAEVEPDYVVQAAAVIPNDPDFNLLYGLNNPVTGSGPDIDAPEAWATTTGNKAVVVAVIDSGVDYTHPELVDNMWTNWGELPGNSIDDDHNGYVDDIHGYDFINSDGDPMDDWFHGTHIAGTIAAAGNNGAGVVGVNWHASIMALKFLSSGGGGSTSGAISALDYAIHMGARVTNNSYGNLDPTPLMTDVIARGLAANQLEVFAAGNFSTNIDHSPFYPASYPADNMIVVAASRSAIAGLAYFSNFGSKSVDVAAPGEDIYSLGLNHGYRYSSGTSMATPHVVGIAALLLAKNPMLTWKQVKDAIMTTVDVQPNMSGLVGAGGTVNAARALAAVPAFDSPVVRLDPGDNPTDVNFAGQLNEPPVIANFGGSITYVENGGPLTLLAATTTITDPDSANFNGGQLKVTISGNGSAADRLAIISQGGGPGQIGVSGSTISFGGQVIGTFNGGVGTAPLTIDFNSAAATAEAVQTLLRGIVFYNLSESPATASRTVRIRVTDGNGGTSNQVMQHIGIVAVNDGPLVSGPLAQNMTRNGSLVFASAQNNAVSVDDSDAGNSAVRLALVATHGTLTLSTMSGLQFVQGANGQSRSTVRGTLAAINAALEGLKFDAANNFVGNASLQLTLADLANSGGGLSASRTIAIAVNYPVFILDNNLPGYAETAGIWNDGLVAGYNNSTTRWSTSANASATWTPVLSAGYYTIAIYKPASANSNSAAQLSIVHNGRTDSQTVDLRAATGGFVELTGTYYFSGAGSEFVKLFRNGGTGPLRPMPSVSPWSPSRSNCNCHAVGAK